MVSFIFVLAMFLMLTGACSMELAYHFNETNPYGIKIGTRTIFLIIGTIFPPFAYYYLYIAYGEYKKRKEYTEKS